MHACLHSWFTALLFIASINTVVYISHVDGFTYGDCELHDPKEYHGHTKFFCYKRNLKKVPPNLPHNVTDVDISYNKISEIKRLDFKNLTHLGTLNISNNHVSHVEKGAFRDMISLTELSLSHNYLRTITNDFFHGLTNLKVLLLERNFISTIENSSFSTLPHLACVKLSGNKLKHMKPIQPIFRMQTMKEIHIAYNNISIFQSADISNSSLTLQMLNLSHNPLDVFSITTDIFPYLEAIDLSGCFSNRSFKWDVPNRGFFKNVKTLYVSKIQVSLEVFSGIVQTFKNSLVQLILNAVHDTKFQINSTCLIPTVTELMLRHNRIENVTETGLERCAQVKEVDLFYNNLNDLEQSFTSLKNLTSLKLGYNNFSHIPKMIQNLSMLESLNFVFNQIEKLDCSSFKNLNNLRTLYLYGNKIQFVKECVFRDLINLEKLFLGTNHISSLKGVFQNGPANLKHLAVSTNALSFLNAGDFSGLKSLIILELNDNKIKKIHEGTFNGLISLRVLNLQFNKITDESLTPSVFSGLSNLTELSLQNNHILKTNISTAPPFYHLKYLKVLSVVNQPHHETQSFIPSNFLRHLTNLDGFWAQNLGLKFLHVDMFKDNSRLTKLDLSQNYLTDLSPDIFIPLQKLYQLYLKDTQLKALDFLVQAKLSHLYYLQVSDNQISSVSETTISSLPGLRLLNMKGNTFTCDCTNANFIRWIDKGNLTQVLSANKYECNSPPNLKLTNLLDLDLQSCSVNTEFFCYIFSTSLVLLTLLISFIYHFLRQQIVFAYYLFLAYIYDKKQGSKSCGFQYDAFVSYNTHNELWVMRELLPKLEGEQGWRLCLHHRDFQPGKPIVDNIVDGIYDSRKTICIISQHYLQSEWCSKEVQVASYRLFDEKKDVLILVFLEDIPVNQLSPYYRMRGLMNKRTYLSWPKAGQDTRVFWEKLRIALSAERSVED